MGFLDIFKGGTVKAIGDTVEKTGSAFDKLFTSDEERQAGKILMKTIEQKPAEWAQELNVISAQSGNWFNSGWRPGLGWVGVLGLFFFFVPQYIVGSVIWTISCWEVLQAGGDIALPVYPVNAEGLMELVFLLLGGATVRAAEKLAGIARN